MTGLEKRNKCRGRKKENQLTKRRGVENETYGATSTK